MQALIKQLKVESARRIALAQTRAELAQIRREFLGKRGRVRTLLAKIKRLPATQRASVGQNLNQLKQEIDRKIQTKAQLTAAIPLMATDFDPTLPSPATVIGHLHPISEMLNRVTQTFALMGFEVLEGPEIDTDQNIFQLLNMPPEHPARDAQDSFYITPNVLPRTHTSSVQMRALKKKTPPFKIIAPGRCYRNEKSDPRHTIMFYQFEGLVIDTYSTLAHLKGTLSHALRLLFEDERIQIRFRQSHFPYTEPSLEVDATCVLCHGKGCRVCQKTGWLELLGAGMVHPQVIKNGRLNPNKYQGFAFGTGPERILMVKHQIPETRMFFENDLRFLYQF